MRAIVHGKAAGNQQEEGSLAGGAWEPSTFPNLTSYGGWVLLQRDHVRPSCYLHLWGSQHQQL